MKELQQLIEWLEAEKEKARETLLTTEINTKAETSALSSLTAFSLAVDKAELLLSQQSHSEIAPPLQQAAVSGSLPPTIDLNSARKLRGYFGGNDAGNFHKWAYSVFDKIVKQLEASSGNGG